MTEKALGYDDVLLKPKRSPVDSRKNVDISMKISPNITLDIPVISSPMDTVTEKEMANRMNALGAMGFVHRFMDINKHAKIISDLSPPTVGVVGINGQAKTRAQKLYHAGIDAFCVDVAHGHLDKALDFVTFLDTTYNTDIIAGNIATEHGAIDLVEAGADTIRVGIGPGSVCTTREKTGFGVPQISAIKTVSTALESYHNTYIISDGGMQTPGDVSKSIMAGADAAMLGSYFAGCKASPNEGVIRGMASNEAQEETGKSNIVEGTIKKVDSSDSVEKKIEEIANGLKSATSYGGAKTLFDAQQKAEFVVVGSGTR